MKHLMYAKGFLGKLSVVFMLAGLLFLSACQHLRYLDFAQDNFNQGATLENQLRFNPQTDVLTSPSLYYNSAYADVNKALQNKDELRKDNLLGNAYAIKALCEWRLKMYDQAEKTANDALEELLAMERKGIRMTRDMALMEALPQLIAIEQVKNSLYALHTSTPPAFASARDHYLKQVFDADPAKKSSLETAIEKINTIQAKLRGNDDLSIYLIQSQLAALKTWSDGLDFLRISANKDDSLSAAAKKDAREFCSTQREDFLNPKGKELVDALGKLLPAGAGEHPLAVYWGRLLGL